MSNTNQYVNREISWLYFNQRVLQEAADSKVPLIERLRFLGIFSNNLDEFFKVRYATVKRIADSGKKGKRVLGGTEAAQLLEEITQIVIRQQTESLEILAEIEKQLEKENIYIIKETEVSEQQAVFIKDYFFRKVFPSLMTIILDDKTEFPRLNASNAYLAVKMIMKTDDDQQPGNYFRADKGKIRYSLIEIPKAVERFVVLPQEGNKSYIIILDDLIRFCLDDIFNMFNYDYISAHMIKITRDAELDIDNDLSKSFIEKLSSSVEGRKISEPVRFVYDKSIEPDTLFFLKQKMGIMNTDSVIPGGRYHNRRDYMSFPSLGKNHLMYEKSSALPIKGLDLKSSLFEKIAEKDYLQYAPYHSFAYTVKFLREAALDPNVKSIKVTIYRLAKDSQIAASLINAAKNGKEVTVLIELRARFDEQANIQYAEELQKEGIKLHFGISGLKVHSKICLVERQEGKKLKRYGFISTGNLNESTSKIYTDFTMFTANQSIMKDISNVFNYFETPFMISKYKHLVVSPHYTRKTFVNLIRNEIKNAKEGKEAYIRVKMNSFTSYAMVDELYEASRSGVKIQLIIRGTCCLIPGVPGMSDNIEAISVVDKFLEHTRLFIFGNEGDPVVYISSADWMTRNLDNRIEVGCPIYDEDVKKQLIDSFTICWKDNIKARFLSKDGKNEYRRNEQPPFRSQLAFYDYYRERLEE